MVKCIAVDCKVGYKCTRNSSNVTEEKVRFYYVPKDGKTIKLWQKAILRDDIKLKQGDAVCAKHFKESDFVHEKIILGQDGNVIGKTLLKKPQLKEGALPSLHLGRKIFSNPSRKLPVKRNLPENSETKVYKRSKKSHDKKTDLTFEDAKGSAVHEVNVLSLTEEAGPSGIEVELVDTLVEDEKGSDADPSDVELNTLSLFQRIARQSIRLPVSWIQSNVSWGNEHGITFVKLIGIKRKNGFIDSTFHKKITIDENMHLNISINGRNINHKDFGINNEKLQSIENLEEMIDLINARELCFGSTNVDMTESNRALLKTFSYTDGIGSLRSNQCSILLPVEANSNDRQCRFCKNIKNVLNKKIIRMQGSKTSNYIHLKKLSPKKQAQINKLRQISRNFGRAKEKAQAKIRLLRMTLNENRKKIILLSETSISEIFSTNEKISANEQLAIREILKSAKCKSPQARRYSDEWLVLCMLLHMKSPTTYQMILDNKILPLPTSRTIRRYLSQMDCPCGFDPRFFEILKTQFDQKSVIELHGLILVDEMGIRKSLLLDQKTMTFKGIEDFGEDIPKELQKQKTPRKARRKTPQETSTSKQGDVIMADHGLVIMFQPLYDTYSQPIAVFVSKNPTKGNILAKLLVQAIVLLEKAGARIHGIVADGGSPNRKVWKEMGCSGNLDSSFKNSFEHPTEENRKIYFFSDTPHLMKTIRNRLASSEMLQVYPNNPIMWEHFRIMHSVDKLLPAGNRLCPRITDAHIDVMKNNHSKMRVSLAVQIFSKSVARGVRYYKSIEKSLEYCEPTAEFCEILNNMFDALNRTKSGTGLKLGCDDIRVLEDTLAWLNAWEKRVQDCLISPEHFLTDETAVGLRMTLHSTIDLTNYLLLEVKTDCVFTGRINQDSLERFFGSIRLAGRCNDHPATPTFLQIYKILTFYSALKPPKTGNCSLPEASNVKPLISMSQLREIFKSSNKNRSSFIEDIKTKLNIVIEQNDNDFTDCINAVDHDYDNPYVIQCLMYFVTGNICKNFTKFTKCDVCRTAFFSSEENTFFSNHPCAQIITRDTDNLDIQHPNYRLYNFLQIIEQSFVRHVKNNHAYSAVIDEITQAEIKFPCSEHAGEVLAYIIHYYVQLRMRQYAKIQVAENFKKSAELKKISKLYST